MGLYDASYLNKLSSDFFIPPSLAAGISAYTHSPFGTRPMCCWSNYRKKRRGLMSTGKEKLVVSSLWSKSLAQGRSSADISWTNKWTSTGAEELIKATPYRGVHGLLAEAKNGSGWRGTLASQSLGLYFFLLEEFRGKGKGKPTISTYQETMYYFLSLWNY